jgi:hypothetical protein
MLVFTPIGGRISSAVIARIIQGIGVGRSSFSVPIFGIEMTTKELRGMMLPGFIQWPLRLVFIIGVSGQQTLWKILIVVGVSQVWSGHGVSSHCGARYLLCA